MEVGRKKEKGKRRKRLRKKGNERGQKLAREVRECKEKVFTSTLLNK